MHSFYPGVTSKSKEVYFFYLQAKKRESPSLLQPVIIFLLTPNLLKNCKNFPLELLDVFFISFLVHLIFIFLRRARRHCITQKVCLCLQACNLIRLYSLPSHVVPVQSPVQAQEKELPTSVQTPLFIQGLGLLAQVVVLSVQIEFQRQRMR